jgi:hypothetical protein
MECEWAGQSVDSWVGTKVVKQAVPMDERLAVEKVVS